MNTKIFFKCFSDLAVVPKEFVREAFNSLCALIEITHDLIELISYFERTYIRAIKIAGLIDTYGAYYSN